MGFECRDFVTGLFSRQTYEKMGSECSDILLGHISSHISRSLSLSVSKSFRPWAGVETLGQSVWSIPDFDHMSGFPRISFSIL